MPKKKREPEEIVGKLRQADVLTPQELDKTLCMSFVSSASAMLAITGLPCGALSIFGLPCLGTSSFLAAF